MWMGIARGQVRLGLCFLLVGGLLGLVARVQLMQPGMTWIGGSEFPGLLTLHALTMVLLSLLPFSLGGFLATLAEPPDVGEPGPWIRRLSGLGLALTVLGGVAIYAVVGFQVANEGLSGLPVPRWLGGIGGRIPPVLPTDAPFLLALTVACLGLGVSGLGLLAAGVRAAAAGRALHGVAAALTGLLLAGLFGSFVVGFFAHAAGAELGGSRPLWWALFVFLEPPAAAVLVAPMVWLVLHGLGGGTRRPGEPHPSGAAVRAFAATALILVSLALAGSHSAASGYHQVLGIHALFVGALLFGGFAVLYDLWPRLFGRVPRPGLALAHWALSLLSGGVLLAGMLGLAGALAPRRVASVPELPPHELWHLVTSFGAFALGGAVLGGLVLGLLAAPRAPVD